MRILVVEDEQKVADALREGLEDERYDVVVERTGEGAFFRVNTETFDVVLLDLTLPGRDGLDILRALRQRRMETPVLVLNDQDSHPPPETISTPNDQLPTPNVGSSRLLNSPSE